MANLTWDKILACSLEVDPSLLERVSAVELRVKYREYVRRIDSLSKEPSKRELSNMQLLELFLLPEGQHLYKEIESVMSVMVRAALMISVESIVESYISTMGNHASQRRTLGEMLIHEEKGIAINGPVLVHCHSIVQVIKMFSD